MARSKVVRSRDKNKLTAADKRALSKMLKPIEERVSAEKARFESARAAEEALRAHLVPLSFGDVCRTIGPDVRVDDFATTSLMSLAMQLEGLQLLAQEETDGGYDQWCAVSNVVERMQLAARVSRWLQRGKPATLPEVQP